MSTGTRWADAWIERIHRRRMNQITLDIFTNVRIDLRFMCTDQRPKPGAKNLTQRRRAADETQGSQFLYQTFISSIPEKIMQFLVILPPKV